MAGIEIAGIGKAGKWPQVCLFHTMCTPTHVGLVLEDQNSKYLCDLTASLGVERLYQLTCQENPAGALEGLFGAISQRNLRKDCVPFGPSISKVSIEAPIDLGSETEVWGAGVTYEASNSGRNEEVQATSGQQLSETVYDKVRIARAERPELFLKATPNRVVGPDLNIHLRKDTKWIIPEPELGLWINPDRKVVGYTLVNDVSCRDIEGENPLYLPQAKMFNGSCATGDLVQFGPYDEEEVRQWDITIKVERGRTSDSPPGVPFSGQTSISKMERGFDNLVKFLCRDQTFMHGVILSTGTGVVPPKEFTLEVGDRVIMSIPQAGIRLENNVLPSTTWFLEG